MISQHYHQRRYVDIRGLNSPLLEGGSGGAAGFQSKLANAFGRQESLPSPQHRSDSGSAFFVDPAKTVQFDHDQDIAGAEAEDRKLTKNFCQDCCQDPC
jgi:hypothetical protein